jgi:hypothetical protein
VTAKASTIAVVNIVVSVLLALAAFIPASLGGFNGFAIAWYSLLAISIATSFYLLAKRRDLDVMQIRRLTGVVVLCLVLTVSPILVGIAYAFLS